MTKGELRKARQAAHAAGQPLTGELAISRIQPNNFNTAKFFARVARTQRASKTEQGARYLDWRQREAELNPKTFSYTTLDDVMAANAAIGNHWFDLSTLAFFKTWFESGLIAGHRFITSEKGPDGRRRYTVRDARPDGTIDTIGEFRQFTTRDEARANVLKSKEQIAGGGKWCA